MYTSYALPLSLPKRKTQKEKSDRGGKGDRGIGFLEKLGSKGIVFKERRYREKEKVRSLKVLGSKGRV